MDDRFYWGEVGAEDPQCLEEKGASKMKRYNDLPQSTQSSPKFGTGFEEP